MYNMRRRGHNEGHMFVPKVLTLYHPKTGKKSSIEGTFMNYVFIRGQIFLLDFGNCSLAFKKLFPGKI